MGNIEKCLEEFDKTKMKSSGLKGYFVYALWRGEEIVYIGQSTNLLGRIGAHTKTKEFDYYSYYTCRDQLEMDNIESVLIYKFKPIYNKALGNGLVSIQKLRDKIRNISEEHRYNADYYIPKLRQKIKELNVETFYFNGIMSIKTSDAQRTIEYILKGDSNE